MSPKDANSSPTNKKSDGPKTPSSPSKVSKGRPSLAAPAHVSLSRKDKEALTNEVKEEVMLAMQSMMSEYKLTQSTQIDGFRDQINSMVKNFGDLQG